MNEEFRVTNLLSKPFYPGQEQVVQVADADLLAKRRKIALSVGSVLLVFLMISVSIGWKRRVDVGRQEQLSSIEDRVRYAIREAENVSALSPARARSLVLGAQTDLEEERAKTEDRFIRSRLEALSAEVHSALQSSGHVIASHPDVYLDLGLVREGTKGSALFLSGRTLFVLDGHASVLLALSATDRGSEVVGGGEVLAGSRTVSGSEKRVYVLADHRIVTVDVEGKVATPVVTDDEGVWQDPIGIAYFATNLYVLDRGTSEVYKYASVQKTGGPEFGDRRRWFNVGVTPNLSDAQSFAVDGDVWILLKDGTIKRFRQGTPLGFSESGSDQFGDAASLSVPVDGTRVWVLDRGAGRVVAFDRESGAYAGQWESDVMKGATSLAVSEELGKIFLLAGEKIYVISL